MGAMPFLKHIIQPLLREELNDIHRELPPSDPTPAQPAPADQQLEQWVAKKQQQYKKFGASPEQLVAWEKYDRNRYASFLNQQQMTDTVKAAHEPALSEALGHAAVGVGDAARAASGRAYMSTIGEPNRRKHMSAIANPSPIAQGTPEGGIDYEKRNKALTPSVAPDAGEAYDPRLQDPKFLYGAAVGSLPKSWLAFKNGAMGLRPVPEVNTPAEPAPAEALQEPKRNKKGQVVLTAAPGEPIGYAEDGQSIDRKGKKLGFLAQQGDTRFADRQARDFSLEDTDADAQKRMQGLYGPALKAVKENEGKYPSGFFKGKSEDEKQNIKAGVQKLMQLERGTKT